MTVLWYEDDKYKIEFDEMPDVEVRHINRMYMSKEEIKEIKKKPFMFQTFMHLLLTVCPVSICRLQSFQQVLLWDDYSLSGADLRRLNGSKN